MKNLLFALLLVAALFVAVSGIPVQAVEKVDICHKPPGNPENIQFISVGPDAVPAHLAHGDVLRTGEVCGSH
jgi:hypothetical protein